jgi:hypothetical protein
MNCEEKSETQIFYDILSCNYPKELEKRLFNRLRESNKPVLSLDKYLGEKNNSKTQTTEIIPSNAQMFILRGERRKNVHLS